jgi:hypothetical protein
MVRVNILSRILVQRQEISGFRIRWSDLLDKLCIVTIVMTQK